MKKVLVIMLTVLMALAMISCDANWSNWPWTYEESTEFTYDDFLKSISIMEVTEIVSGYDLDNFGASGEGTMPVTLSNTGMYQEDLYDYVEALQFLSPSILPSDFATYVDNAWKDSEYELALAGTCDYDFTDEENYSVSVVATITGTYKYETVEEEEKDAPINITVSYNMYNMSAKYDHIDLSASNLVVNKVNIGSLSYKFDVATGVSKVKFNNHSYTGPYMFFGL